jgi:GT2 family glycosyltransferase
VYEPKGLIYHKVSASTGKTSNLITYYIVRNKQYLIQKYISLYFKPLAYLYVFLENIKRTIQGEYMWVAVKRGFVDFIKGITGELTEKI